MHTHLPSRDTGLVMWALSTALHMYGMGSGLNFFQTATMLCMNSEPMTLIVPAATCIAATAAIRGGRNGSRGRRKWLQPSTAAIDLRVLVQVPEQISVPAALPDVRQQVHQPLRANWLLRPARVDDSAPARLHPYVDGHVDRVLHAHHHCDLSLLFPHLNVKGLLYPLQRDATTGLSPMALRMCNRWCSLWLNSVGWLRV